jgi:hypothetical protein
MGCEPLSLSCITQANTVMEHVGCCQPLIDSKKTTLTRMHYPDEIVLNRRGVVLRHFDQYEFCARVCCSKKNRKEMLLLHVKARGMCQVVGVERSDHATMHHFSNDLTRSNTGYHRQSLACTTHSETIGDTRRARPVLNDVPDCDDHCHWSPFLLRLSLLVRWYIILVVRLFVVGFVWRASVH